jgi:FkbM family methyltransferase
MSLRAAAKRVLPAPVRRLIWAGIELSRQVARPTRKALRGAMLGATDAVAGRALFGRSRRLRAVGFDVLSRRQPLIVCAREGGEAYVVHAGDRFIGRGLFVDGEFDFDKFVAAIEVLQSHRPGFRPRLLIDVGGNVGSICIPAVRRGHVERAVAVEPDPTNARLLRANIALNGMEAAIRVAETAAGAEDGQTLELELADENLGDHRIRVSGEQGRHNEAARPVVQVPSARLDTICAAELGEDLLVWMDVQGFEGYVLAGSTDLLSRRVPVVLEFCPYLLDRAGSFPLLRASLAGYDSFIDLSEPARLRPIRDLDSLYALYAGLGAEASTDILFV